MSESDDLAKAVQSWWGDLSGWAAFTLADTTGPFAEACVASEWKGTDAWPYVFEAMVGMVFAEHLASPDLVVTQVASWIDVTVGLAWPSKQWRLSYWASSKWWWSQPEPTITETATGYYYHPVYGWTHVYFTAPNGPVEHPEILPWWVVLYDWAQGFGIGPNPEFPDQHWYAHATVSVGYARFELQYFSHYGVEPIRHYLHIHEGNIDEYGVGEARFTDAFVEVINEHLSVVEHPATPVEVTANALNGWLIYGYGLQYWQAMNEALIVET